MTHLAAVVLAAGHGKRMKSALPKVMHTIAGRPLVHYPVSAVLDAGASHVVVVVGHERQHVTDYLSRTFGNLVSFAVQQEQRGTGHAALQALPMLPETVDTTLVVYGDTPLLDVENLRHLALSLDNCGGSDLALLTCNISDPGGYGRILRNEEGNVVEVREDKDLRSDEERSIREVNPGVYCARASFLRNALERLKPNNAQGELYLTDIVGQAAKVGIVRDARGREENLLGVNDRGQLAQAEELMQKRLIASLRRSGVTVRKGASIDATVEIEPDATIEANVVLRGKTRIESGARIDIGSVITDSFIGKGALIKPYCVVTSSRVESKAEVGPFAHLRPDSIIGEQAHVGNFVETKKTVMHRGSKANHLSYLGDGEIGEGANIGAGTIFCNYDGFQKHKTVIGRGAFIGSDSQMVAPVVIGDNAYVATATTVTRDVPPDALAIARVRQENKEGYASRLRERFAEAKRSKG